MTNMVTKDSQAITVLDGFRSGGAVVGWVLDCVELMEGHRRCRWGFEVLGRRPAPWGRRGGERGRSREERSGEGRRGQAAGLRAQAE
ncbi:hypothetical protein GCM10010504_01730 [Streptomyces griseus]|nr:hypothetical protein GCM10010504_01730 [Streptomyces griseus]